MWKKKEKRKEKKRGRGSRVGRGWKRKKTEGDGTGWRSILIWSQKWVFLSCLQSCSSPKLTATPDIQTSRCDPDRAVGLEGGLAPSVNFFLKSLQTSVMHFNHTQKKTLMQEVRAALYDSDRDECVIVVEVTGADSTSVQFEMRRWTDRRDTCLKLDRCQNLKGSRTVGRIWATDKSKRILKP